MKTRLTERIARKSLSEFDPALISRISLKDNNKELKKNNQFINNSALIVK